MEVIAPRCELDWAHDDVDEKSMAKKEVAVKLAISANCRRLDIRVQDRPKDTLTLGPTNPTTCQRIQNQSKDSIGCSDSRDNLSEGSRTTGVIRAND